ncbi:MAG TPA: pentapeptide repeat-containing protein, partial [Methanocorpusculum sp.]|nr:pentapeptide repeat-containing protein [Methanocorpusculum sp.]
MGERYAPPGGNGPFDQEQYERLLRCEKKGDFSKWNEWIQKERNKKWNEWIEKRNKHNESEILISGPEKTYDIIKLAGADLTNLNLKGIDLMFAHLEGANLSGANLEAFLTGAHLNGANFSCWLVPISSLGSPTKTTLSGANLND